MWKSQQVKMAVMPIRLTDNLLITRELECVTDNLSTF